MKRHQQLPLLISLVLVALLARFPGMDATVWAGPVDWQEVKAAAAGRQWWDSGSLRLDRAGHLSVLSRFQPAPSDQSENPNGRAAGGTLYVMQLDCQQRRWRDVAVNGLPRPRASWQEAGQDDLTDRVLQSACQAAEQLGLPVATAPA
ncbi:MAG: hypothetical protein VKI83_09230 [Synechococcaceae cyanobacterium]|nr:hypothetical protein [Synechococcaceae cyanobacterium]